jgi:hypothetical protein
MADRALYPKGTNVPSCKEISFKFFVDAGNAPTLAGAGVSGTPLNLSVASVSRVSQGLYRLVLSDAYKTHVRTLVALNVTGAGVARWAQSSVLANVGTSTAVTLDILVVDNAGAVQNPAAAATDNYISGAIIFADIASV